MKKFGQKCEKIALEYLQKEKGYILLFPNYRARIGEIDLICKTPKGKIAFIEVKSRRGKIEDVIPEQSINYKKLIRISRAIKQFLGEYKIKNISIQFDIIAIIQDNDKFYIRHYEDISQEINFPFY